MNRWLSVALVIALGLGSLSLATDAGSPPDQDSQTAECPTTRDGIQDISNQLQAIADRLKEIGEEAAKIKEAVDAHDGKITKEQKEELEALGEEADQLNAQAKFYQDCINSYIPGLDVGNGTSGQQIPIRSEPFLYKILYRAETFVYVASPKLHSRADQVLERLHALMIGSMPRRGAALAIRPKWVSYAKKRYPVLPGVVMMVNEKPRLPKVGIEAGLNAYYSQAFGVAGTTAAGFARWFALPAWIMMWRDFAARLPYPVMKQLDQPIDGATIFFDRLDWTFSLQTSPLKAQFEGAPISIPIPLPVIQKKYRIYAVKTDLLFDPNGDKGYYSYTTVDPKTILGPYLGALFYKKQEAGNNSQAASGQ